MIETTSAASMIFSVATLLTLRIPEMDERRLASRVAGTLWLTAAVLVVGVLLLPGAERDDVVPLLAVVGGSTVWAFLCFTTPPERSTVATFHGATLASLTGVAVAVAATGGAASPFPLFLWLIVAYCAYFFELRTALVYFALAALVHALPLVYDSHGATALLLQLWVAVPGYFAIGSAVTMSKRQLVALREHARDQAMHDSLTGLANRRALLSALEQQVGGERESDRVGLMIVDLDGFKDVNTLYGHPAGDRVLQLAAGALGRCVRDGDLVARLGGDEFAIVAPGADAEVMQLIAARALAGLREVDEHIDEMPGYALRGSAGWAVHPEQAATMDELFATADLAIRDAKAGGKDRASSPLEWVPSF